MQGTPPLTDNMTTPTPHTALDFRRHYRVLLSLGIPIIIGQIGTIVQGLADTIMMGQYSAHALAAASFVNSIMTLVLVAGMGYSYGLTPVVGGLFARGEYEDAGRALRASLSVNGKMGMSVTALMGGLYFFLDRLGQPADLLPQMRIYYLAILCSLPLQMLFNAFKQFVDGVGRTRTSMWILLTANAANIVGNWLFIYGVGPLPEMGILGAGLSTLLSRLLMLVLIAGIVLGSRPFSAFRRGLFQTEHSRSRQSELHRLGWPVALQMGMETAAFSLTAVMQGWLGAAQLAAHQIMCNVGAVCFLVYYGLGAAVAIRISHFRGVGDEANVRRSAQAGFRLTMLAGILLAGSIVAARQYVGRLFTPDAEVNRIVLSLLFPFVLYQFGDALQTNYANALRGTGDVRPMMRYACISYMVVSLPLSYLFGIYCGWGATGIWMAFPAGLTLAGVLYRHRFVQQTQQRMANSHAISSQP